ncbi:uncharacterized protein MICPUCDRAFT_56791 [Micromonas pusilla CCMP1545]|uniref:Predicted protein n=2 Tax=Micromonas pusilla TaxID=38833 RepID=C1MN59_MICPC|nr:uncharacterized protein MICPUCDRAFT_56791 [Micromonas pusilla CCMP1545]EEH59168.1 predicted protein [Micromonas pusilla CCMP1545]|eukprot:XP_003057523.1 predicted protein [Micromonas pusilla CCMP1545]
MASATIATLATLAPVARRGGGGRGDRGSGGRRGGGRGRGGVMSSGGAERQKTRTRHPRRRPHRAANDETMDAPATLWAPPLDGQDLPALVCFDLDDTIWFPELYMMRGAPWTKERCDTTGRERVMDASGEELRCYPAATAAMAMLRSHAAFAKRGTKIAVASRTNRGAWADEVMGMFVVDDGSGSGTTTTMRECVGDLVEMYSGTKKRHFEKLKARTGIPYADMLFFDNEEQNTRDVATLGVTCVLCVGGMTERAWEDGLRAFAEKKALVARRRAAAAAKR